MTSDFRPHSYPQVVFLSLELQSLSFSSSLISSLHLPFLSTPATYLFSSSFSCLPPPLECSGITLPFCLILSMIFIPRVLLKYFISNTSLPTITFTNYAFEPHNSDKETVPYGITGLATTVRVLFLRRQPKTPVTVSSLLDTCDSDLCFPLVELMPDNANFVTFYPSILKCYIFHYILLHIFSFYRLSRIRKLTCSTFTMSQWFDPPAYFASLILKPHLPIRLSLNSFTVPFM